jgi:hypothetical protein
MGHFRLVQRCAVVTILICYGTASLCDWYPKFWERVIVPSTVFKCLNVRFLGLEPPRCPETSRTHHTLTRCTNTPTVILIGYEKGGPRCRFEGSIEVRSSEATVTVDQSARRSIPKDVNKNFGLLTLKMKAAGLPKCL